MATEDEILIEELASFAERPLDFVYWAFPWGEKGTSLEHYTGPVGWQIEVLRDLQEAYARGRREGSTQLRVALSEAYQIAIRSGHDVGKTALLAFLVWWGLSTLVDTRGRATANTEKQLRTILWSELAKWQRLFIGGHLFTWTATSIYSRDPEHNATWRFDAVTWSEDNPEGFAGMHNAGKRVLVVTDEASGIADKVWEVIDGVMHEAETELIWIAPGNPTKNTGRFRECWGRFASEWHTYIVDSRSVPFANKAKIDRAIEIWGEDSDYVKVRYLGQFPETASTQLIPLDAIQTARARPPVAQPWEPLIMAVDVARFGDNKSVAVFRRGKDAKSTKAIRWQGLSVIELGDKVASLINQHSPDGVFIDEGGVGGGVVDYVRSLGHIVYGVQFGGKPGTFPNGVRVHNKRAEIYVHLRDALVAGLAIEDDQELEEELVAIEYFITKPHANVALVAKEDMEGASPDWADALAMTYALPISPRARRSQVMEADYDPLDFKELLKEVA